MLSFKWIMRPLPVFAATMRPVWEQIHSSGPMRQVGTESVRPELRWAVAEIKQETYDLHAVIEQEIHNVAKQARPNIAFSLPLAEQTILDLAIPFGILGHAPVASTFATPRIIADPTEFVWDL